MIVMGIIVGAAALIGVMLILVGNSQDANRSRLSDDINALRATGIGTVVVSVILGLILGFMAFMPNYRLHRATIEKRILVEEARAQADSAIELARAEVERARGTAEANRIVAESITEPYLRYLYINQLADTSNQVIYLPTEAGLPILEAPRLEENVGSNE